MITLETIEDGRTMRVFVRDMSQLALLNATGAFWGDDDHDREPLLRNLMLGDVVQLIAYPTTGQTDVLQVFVRDPSREQRLLFACTLISGERLHSLLEENQCVVENFSLQVAPGVQLTSEGACAAVQAWVERCFPDVTPPEVVVDVWTDARGVSEDALPDLKGRTMAKKKRLTVEVTMDQFNALKALQRVLGLNSAEEVLLYSAKAIARAVVDTPEGAFALGIAFQTANKRSATMNDDAADEPYDEPRVGTNLGDKLRDAMKKEEGK